VKRENFTPIMINGMYGYSHSDSTLNVEIAREIGDFRRRR